MKIITCKIRYIHQTLYYIRTKTERTSFDVLGFGFDVTWDGWVAGEMNGGWEEKESLVDGRCGWPRTSCSLLQATGYLVRNYMKYVIGISDSQ